MYFLSLLPNVTKMHIIDSLLYNCVLFLCFRLIKEHDCNIFSNMQKTDFRDFRNLIIDMVLHTDMSQHFSQLKAMKTMIQQNSGESRYSILSLFFTHYTRNKCLNSCIESFLKSVAYQFDLFVY